MEMVCSARSMEIWGRVARSELLPRGFCQSLCIYLLHDGHQIPDRYFLFGSAGMQVRVIEASGSPEASCESAARTWVARCDLRHVSEACDLIQSIVRPRIAQSNHRKVIIGDETLDVSAQPTAPVLLLALLGNSVSMRQLVSCNIHIQACTEAPTQPSSAIHQPHLPLERGSIVSTTPSNRPAHNPQIHQSSTILPSVSSYATLRIRSASPPAQCRGPRHPEVPRFRVDDNVSSALGSLF